MIMTLNLSNTDTKTYRLQRIFYSLILLFFSLSGFAQAQSDFSGRPSYKPEIPQNQFSKFLLPQEKHLASEVFNRQYAPTADGDLDPNFNASVTEGTGYVSKTVVQPDGKIIAIGYFQRVNGTRASSIARLNADGTLDTSFITGTGITQAGVTSPLLHCNRTEKY